MKQDFLRRRRRTRRIDPDRAVASFVPSCVVCVLGVLSVGLVPTSAQSQIVRDATAGQTNIGLIQPDASGVITLNGDDGIRRGSNNSIVVHGFSDYNLDAGQTALYTDNAAALSTTSSVLSLVRGNSASTLNGAIQSKYLSADMYFVNPNGVFFGSGFSVDVPGSFHVSTADSLQWDATGPAIDMSGPLDVPLLTAAVPTSWGFLGAGPEKQITIENFAAVDAGIHSGEDTFSFVGSNLVIGDPADFGFIRTGGRNLVAVAMGQAGDVVIGDENNPLETIPLLPTGPSGAPTGRLVLNGELDTRSGGFRSGDVLALGVDIDMQRALISTSAVSGTANGGNVIAGGQSVFFEGDANTGGAGRRPGGDFGLYGLDSVTLGPSNIDTRNRGVDGRSGSVTIESSRQFGTISAVDLRVTTDGGVGPFGLDGADAGGISFIADTIDLTNPVLNARVTGSDLSTNRGGVIAMTGRQTFLRNSAVLNVNNFGSQDAGLIEFLVAERMDFENTRLFAANTGSGNGGTILVDDSGVLDFTSSGSFVFNLSAVSGQPGSFIGPMPNSPIGTPSQIVRDGTLGQTSGTLTDVNGVITIDGNDGVRRGSNNSIVVHSFSDYNLDDEQLALYTDNPAALVNTTSVLSLVRGSSSSTLDGGIQSKYQSADMYFVNPNGVFFGSGFSVDVPASFHVSTADSLQWDPTGSAIDMSGPIQIPSLTAATPMSWGFLGGGPSKQITIRDFNAIDSGSHSGDAVFSFVGSDLIIGDPNTFGFVGTHGRHFTAVALGGAGNVFGFTEVDNPATNLSLLPFGPNGVAAGRLELNAEIDTRGSGTRQGDMLLWGGDVDLQQALLSTFSTSSGTVEGGDVSVLGEIINFEGDLNTGGSGGADGGDVEMLAFDSLNLTSVNINTQNSGVGGTTGDTAFFGSNTITGNNVRVTTAGLDSDAGTIVFIADTIDLTDARLTAGAGRNSQSTSQSGGIVFSGRELFLRNSAVLTVSNFGSQDAGTIVFQTTETLDFENTTLRVNNTGSGDGGLIFVDDSSGTLAFTSDANFAFDLSAVSGTPGTFLGPMPNGSPPPPPPPPPPTNLPPLLETTIETLDEVTPFLSSNTSDLGSSTVVDLSSETGADPIMAENSGEETDEADREELAAVAPETPRTPSVSSGPGVAAVSGTDSSSGEELSALAQAGAVKEAETAATHAATKQKTQRVPGVNLFTNTSQRAPRVPRTCDLIESEDPENPLLVNARRRIPASPEDWLLAYDTVGDRLLAASDATLELPPVAAPGLAGSDEATRSAASDRRRRAQQALTAAAMAVRNDRYADALRSFEAAVSELEAAGDSAAASETLLAFAQLQLSEGHFGDAQKSLEQALVLAELAGEPGRIAKVHASLGNALVGTGELVRAEEELTRGLGFALESENPTEGASVLNNLGNRHAATHDYESALFAYERAAVLAHELDRPADEARARAGAARSAVDSGKLDAARAHLVLASELISTLQTASIRAPLNIHIGRTYATLAKVTTVGRADAVLGAYAAFSTAATDATQIGDDRILALAHLNLGSLYSDEQHRSEALYLTRLARQEAERIGALELLYRAHWQEGQILWSEHRINDALSAHRRAVAILEETKPIASAGYASSDAQFYRTVGGVYLDTVDLLLRTAGLTSDPRRSQSLILEARSTLEMLKGAELRDYFEDNCIANVRGDGRNIDNLGAGAAVIYMVTFPDRLELLVGLAGRVERFTSQVTEGRLSAAVDRFRTQVQNPRSTEYLALGRQLYDWLVEPYAARLAEAGVDTIVFIPDGRLRTLPFGALYDGESYLADRYAMATALSLDLLSAPGLGSGHGRALLAGVSDGVQGFSPLEAVRGELSRIQELEGGELLLNQSFTLDSMRQAVAQEIPGVVHLATHAIFTGNPDTSFLLTYTGRVGFNDLSDVMGMTRVGGAPLELLVLSACETAVGNDRAGLGFAGSAIRAGARSALGSLWPIADEAAQELMVDFYQRIQSKELSKAEALRQAQAQLRTDAHFDHPYYWAPFTLVNDWL